MELPKLIPRGAPFKFAPSTARFQSLHSFHNPRSGCLKKLWAAFILLFLTFLFLYFFKGYHHHVLQQHASYFQQFQGYGVAIDIGRLEARVHVLQFGDAGAIRVLGREYSLAPYNVPVAVGNLLKFAKGYVPEGEREKTRVYVVGTGGLDWVLENNRVTFLEECRKSVKQSEFLFREEWAMVLNGGDEGVYEWVAANYARTVVQSDPTDTIGVLNLGDESAQVTFVSETVLPFAYFHKIELRGTAHNLYSYSFDKLGLETASKRLLKLLNARAVALSTSSSGNNVVLDPCCPHGFRGPTHFGTEVAADTEGTATSVETFPTIPSGNFSACRAESFALLQQGQEACHDKNCPAGTIFVPELRGNFVASGKFYDTAKYFKLPDKASIADLIAAGENYCGGDVGDVAIDAFPEYEVVRKPCFSASFIVAFLHDSLGLPVSSSQVMFTDAVNSVPVEWTVGFLLTQLLENNSKSTTAPVIVFGDIFGNNVALLVGVSVVFGLLWWFVARWRRPQLKTIYDLEKGRYFTTAARGR